MNIYISRNQPDSVILAGEEAIALAPDNYQLYQVLGQMYSIQLNDPMLAEKYFKKSIQVAGEGNASALRDMGFFYYNQAVEVNEQMQKHKR